MFDEMFWIFIQMQEEPDEDSQCLSDDTDTEISTQVCTILFSPYVVGLACYSCRSSFNLQQCRCVTLCLLYP